MSILSAKDVIGEVRKQLLPSLQPFFENPEAVFDAAAAKVVAQFDGDLKDRETQFTDWLDARLETHRARITMPADGKGGVIVEWEAKG